MQLGSRWRVGDPPHRGVPPQLHAAIAAQDVALGEHGLRMTVSIGACHLQGGTGNLHELLGEADRQLYLAKAAGRNRVLCTTAAG